jgi:hypothetical protein
VTRGRFWSISPGEDSDEESDGGSTNCSPVEISIDSLARITRPRRQRSALSHPRRHLRFTGGSRRRFSNERRRFNSDQVRRAALQVQFQLFRSSLQRQGRFSLNLLSSLRLLSCSSLLMRSSGWWCRGGDGRIGFGDVVAYVRRRDPINLRGNDRLHAIDFQKMICWAIWARLMLGLMPKF